jgi:tight adherence protein B
VTAALLAAAAVLVGFGPPPFPAGRWRPRAVVVTLAAAVAAVGVGALLGAPEPAFLAMVLAGGAAGAHRLWRQRVRAAVAEQTRERVLECCDLLAAELAAGQPADAALDQAADAWPAIGPVAQCQAYGGDVPAALRRTAMDPGAEGMALVAAAWHVSHRTGHGLADALRRVAQALRDARATDRVVRGELASARATARLVAALPLVALAMGAGSGGDPLSFLLGTPIGLACLAGGLGLGLAGLAWIERLASEGAR